MQKILLLVDDEPLSLRTLEKIFKSCDYQLLTAQNGKDALKILAHTNVHVVLSDLSMPETSGSELLAEVKKLYPETIRLVSSAYTDFDAIKDAINEGSIYKFISKPWNIEFLRNTVAEAFQIYAAQNKSKSVVEHGILIADDELQQALDQQQFLLHYQPIFTAATKKIVGVEALIRWQHPIHGLLSPVQFIPLCEESGLIIPIGIWVLRTACHQLRRWHVEGFQHLHLAVNLSARQFNHAGLLELITEILTETNVPADCLELEITESLVMENQESNIAQLQALRQLGVQLSLDDFGTGYSSLSYLSELPVNILKIDKSFVQDIMTKPNIIDILTMIINLAEKLNLTVIAEGVETEAQLKQLIEQRCHLIQGYLLSKPILATDVSRLLQKIH